MTRPQRWSNGYPCHSKRGSPVRRNSVSCLSCTVKTLPELQLMVHGSLQSTSPYAMLIAKVVQYQMTTSPASDIFDTEQQTLRETVGKCFVSSLESNHRVTHCLSAVSLVQTESPFARQTRPVQNWRWFMTM
jgi:hypothetical protein